MCTQPNRLCWLGIIVFSLLSSIALADPAEDMAKGEEAFNREDLNNAIILFTKAAEQNYAPAQVRLGEILDSSEYDKDAVNWYRKAAEQGYAEGEYDLGHMYAFGEGVEKNAEKAVYWFRRAAQQDHVLALRTLAMAYQKGELGLTVDLDLAKQFEERARFLESAAKKAKKAGGKSNQGAEK